MPVIYGATYPIINTAERFQAWEAVHGVLPWEGVFAPYNATAEALGSDPTSGTDPNRIVASAFLEGFPNTTAVPGKNAASFMVEQVHKYPGQVSIYAAGAMTSVALAVRLDDEFASLAKELVIMGGYLDVNMLQVRILTPQALSFCVTGYWLNVLQATGSVLQADLNSDINLMVDPEAAKIALTAAFPSITIAGNVANQVPQSQEFIDELYEVKTPYTELMYRYTDTDFPFWDETAMALLIDPTIATNTSTRMLSLAYGGEFG